MREVRGAEQAAEAEQGWPPSQVGFAQRHSVLQGMVAQVKNGSGRAYWMRLCPPNCMEGVAVFWSFGDALQECFLLHAGRLRPGLDVDVFWRHVAIAAFGMRSVF